MVSAFNQLEKFLDSDLSKTGKVKKVVFFDELPWINTSKSNFLSSLEHFWNSYGSQKNNLVLVVCGSAASWMLQNIVRAKGGLHNRLTRQIRLLPFSLTETKEFLKMRAISNLSDYMIIQLYMAFGGVPYYLKQIESGQSAAQAIDAACFANKGQLRHEYEVLYSSLFDNSELHVKVVELLADHRSGLKRSEILDKSGIKSGGTATKVITELEESGFISSYIPFNRTSKDALYRLSDEFSLFHLTWIKPLGKKSAGEGYWLSRQNSQKYKIWTGFSFESLCLKHVSKIKEKLSIAGMESSDCPWRYTPTKDSDESGAQIDLLIDRKDGVINICEMKFYNAEFSIEAQYAIELRNKAAIFRKKVKTKKSIFFTFITTFGLNKNANSAELEAIDLKISDLF